MREIKFRAWMKNKMWKVEAIDFGRNGVDLRDDQGKGVYVEDSKELQLMQFTGLEDKQWKEIYEGDIVKFKSSEQGKQSEFYEQKHIVNFGNGGFYVGSIYFSECNRGEGNNFYRNTHTRGALDRDLYYVDFDFEVIGNIYENPELMEATP